METTCNNKNRSKALILGTIIYAIGNFGTKMLSFLIVPLYTYYILPSDMGTYDLLNTTISMLTPLITLQISDGAYAYMIKNVEDSRKYIVSVYKFVFIMSVITSVVILTINAFFKITYVYYFLLLLLVSRFFQTLQKLLRGLKNQKLFAVSGVLYTVIFLALNLIQIVVLKMGVVALFQSAIIANLICIIFIIIREKRLQVLSSYNENLVETQKEMLRYSVPLIPNQLNWWVMSSSDRYIIKFFLNSAANGIYAIAYKFPSMLQLIYGIFYASWQDMAIADTDKDTGNFYTKVFKIYYRCSFTFLIFLIPFTKIFIRLVMSKAYQDAVCYISFLYLGTVFQAFSSFFGVGYLKNNKTSKAATTSIYGAIINAVVNIALIKFIGLYAAAISTFLGFFAMFIFRVIQTKDIMNITMNWCEFFVLFVIALVVAIIGTSSNMKLDCIISIIGILIFILVNKKIVKELLAKFYKKVRNK